MPSPRISLILGVHNHQPVDNWDHVVEHAYQKCYQPFLDVLEAHPAVAMAMHYTGFLLDWIERHHPEHLEQLRRLIDRGQVEMMTGGCYEPILAIIPDPDKVGQIRGLTERVRTLLDTRPTGMWQAERVWEPHLAKFIAEAGVEWLCLDDSHFKAAGFDDHQLFGRYVTEEQGESVEIFPVNKELRYRIPFDPVEAIVEYILSQADGTGERAAIYLDDGEKFGVWPGTHKHVYTEKWLDRFFTAIEQHSDVIRSVTPSQYRKQSRPLGRVYLPTASYSEMMEWALPSNLHGAYKEALEATPEPYRRFIRAGFWRHFLVKYPEANNLHKKMLHVARKVHRMNGDRAVASAEALDHLWQGQSNDVFWHGFFGGLYLTNLRTVNYRHLIEAENLADAALRGDTFLEVTETDFDADGQPELLVETPLQNLYFDPDEGGGLFELDFRPRAFNLLDTLSRRHEPYHHRMKDGSEEDREELLHYDWYRRMSLLDHFLGGETTLDAFKKAHYPEQGDFVNRPYTWEVHQDGVTLSRDGHVWFEGEQFPVTVSKTVTVAADRAEARIAYRLTNRGPRPVDLWFAPEFNVNMLAPKAPDRYYYLPDQPVNPVVGGGTATAEAETVAIRYPHLGSTGKLKAIDAIGMRDEWFQVDVQLRFSVPADLWRFPVETVSQSESGYDRVYQSSVLLPQWRMTLEPGADWSVEITQTIG